MAGTIRLAKISDAEQIAEIYSHFVLNTPVSFEAVAPDSQEMAGRIETVLEYHPWLVCESEGNIAGYAYASQHRNRYHYQWSVDVTVYIHEAHRRQGVGRALYTSLLSIVPLQGYISAYAGITLPNAGSVGLHESMGFSQVGVYRNVGFKQGAWHNVGWWQLALAEPPEDPKDPIPLYESNSNPVWLEGLVSGVKLLRI